MEVGEFIQKTPWYRKSWGEALLAIITIVSIGAFLFIGSVAVEVDRILRTEDVDDVAGTGAISVASNTKPVSDTSKLNLLVNTQMAIGNPDAELTIVEYADFGCPYSREASFAMREMAAKYPNRFYYVYRDFPILDLHPTAQDAALAGRCAAEKGKFWAYHDKLYANQGSHDLMSLVRYASEIGLDAEDFAVCLGSKKYVKEVQADFEAGVQLGLRGTPTFFLNDHRAEGPLPADSLEALLLKFPER